MLLPMKVEYSRTYPKINAYKTPNEERFKLQVLTKAENWAYEKEYRIVFERGPGIAIQLPKGIINRVILGCQISSENKQKIISILKDRKENISLFQATRSRSKFALCFKKINY